MKRILRSVAAVAIAAVCSFGFAACGDDPSDAGNTDKNKPAQITMPDGEMFTPADSDATFATGKAVAVTLNGNTATALSDNVVISDGNVKITAEGTYILSGTLSGGTVTVDAGKDDKVKIVLNNASLTCPDYAALYVRNAAKVFVVLQGENTLCTTGKLTVKNGEATDGALHAEDDITLLGDGKLTIDCAHGKGIVGKDDVKITGGNISVAADEHAIDANNSVRIKNATLTLSAGKDGIHSEHKKDAAKGFIYMESGSVTATVYGDGFDASGAIDFCGGSVDITAGGGAGATASQNSAKGFKSTGDMLISGGAVVINSSDDGIHADGSVKIVGGSLIVRTGDDGVHADSSLVIENGTVTVAQSYEGLEAQNVTIAGGTVHVTAVDDGINAAGGKDYTPPPFGGRPQDNFLSSSTAFIEIRGGSIYVNAGGDGVDANGSITVSGGSTFIEGPTDSRNGAFDYDVKATATGGTFVAIGSSGMAANFTDAKQGCILLQVGAQSAGARIAAIDKNGNTVFETTATKQFSLLLISSPKLVKNGVYTFTVGNHTETVTLSSLIYGKGFGMRPRF